jgi:hypothetical protein
MTRKSRLLNIPFNTELVAAAAAAAAAADAGGDMMQAPMNISRRTDETKASHTVVELLFSGEVRCCERCLTRIGNIRTSI